jgi:hypothetical protein
MSRYVSKLFSGPTLRQLTASRVSLLRTIPKPVNYTTGKGRHLKRIEEQILAAEMNRMAANRTHRSKNKNSHLKGGKTRRQRGTR